MNKPDPTQCLCRHNSVLFNTTDTFDGHAVSCNPQSIKNSELQKLFEYGAKHTCRNNFTITGYWFTGFRELKAQTLSEKTIRQ